MGAGGHFERKAPEINRGYYARVSALTQLLHQLISVIEKTSAGNSSDNGSSRGPVPVQIVNLGAGFDSLYWRLKSHRFSGSSPSRKSNSSGLTGAGGSASGSGGSGSSSNTASSNSSNNPGVSLRSFVEVDLIGVTMRKLNCIRRRPELLQLLMQDGEEQEIRFSQSELHASDYHLITADLRSAAASEHAAQTLKDKLMKDCNLDPDVVTIFLSECVLVYMEVTQSAALLQLLSSCFDRCFHINYEQVNLNDRFGQIMSDNLRQMHADLLGLDACQSIETQEKRFTNHGFDEAKSWDMNHIYNKFLPRPEIERIEKIEFLDERNLLEQLLSHYCITVAAKGMAQHVHVKDLVH